MTASNMANNSIEEYGVIHGLISRPIEAVDARKEDARKRLLRLLKKSRHNNDFAVRIPWQQLQDILLLLLDCELPADE